MRDFHELREDLNEISSRLKKAYLRKATGAKDDDDFGDAKSVTNLSRAKSYKQKDRMNTAASPVPTGGQAGNKDLKRQLRNRKAGIKRAAGDKEGGKLYKRAAKAGQRSGHDTTKSANAGAGEKGLNAFDKRMRKLNKRIG